MSFLDTERDTCEGLLPGLLKRLGEVPLMELERPGGPGIALFRDAGGTGLVVPKTYHGLGASALQAVRITRALAAQAPSLAVATTMHQFSVAGLVALARANVGFEWMLLEAVATDRRLVASGFAEGHAGRGILTPTMTARRDGANWRVTGAKRPCSLSASMDLLTASVAVPTEDGGTRLGVALIPAESPGITIEPFWASPVLTGAESDAVLLNDVEVHPDLFVYPEIALDGQLDDLQTIGFVWFQLLVTACYLGVASALVERALTSGRGPVTERADLATAIQGAAIMLDGAARSLDDGDGGNDALGRALVVRFSAANTIATAVRGAVDLLGGMAFISSPEVAYLAAASHAVAFHPPSRVSAAVELTDWFAGQPLVLS